MLIFHSMDRRSFLLGTGGLCLTQLLAGCSHTEAATLNIQLLNGSIPPQLVGEFRQTLKQSAKLNFSPVKQLEDLFTKLASWRQQTAATHNQQWWHFLPKVKSQSNSGIDLVTLGDYWLATAIRQRMIQPLDLAQLQQWENLPKRWQELVKRNNSGYLDPQGQVWAAPYSWGTTVIAYNRDKFNSLNWTPKDWSDLWRHEVRGQISLLDHAREVIGLTLKKLGYSYNTSSLKISGLEKELVALNQQVKFYSSTTYLQPLITGDTWLAVGWSTDVLPMIQRYSQIAAVVPQSGTAIWSNLWVRPKSENFATPLSNKWIDFCWQPKIAQQISLLSRATSPVPVQLNPSKIDPQFRNLLLIEPQLFDKSEFLQPLPPETIEQYQSLWKTMRQIA